jgi:hypothetical protein
MTREEILAMDPGREMDALVGEKVFGLQIYWVRDEITDYYPVDERDVVIDHFSTDISAAMGVEAKIMQMEWHIQHKYLLTLHRITGVYGEMNLKDIFSMMQASPADRCKAALLAAMEWKDEGV